MLNLLLVDLAFGRLLIQSHRSVSALSSTNKLDPKEANQLANEQTNHADSQTNEDASHDRNENCDNTHEERVSKSMSVVRSMVTVMAVVALVSGRSVRAQVWRHAALQLAVALSIWSTKDRSDVARHLVRWTSLVAAASTELAEAGVLCRLELFINSVKEAAKRSRKGVALLRWRAGGTVRRTIGVLSRAVVWVWWWRRWAERHREVVHHVLMSWLDG